MREFTKKIFDFAEGNLRMLGSKFNRLPEFRKEQILYRLEICKETCIKKGSCEVCGCSVPGKLYSTRSCNGGEKFPDLMSKSKWIVFKKENGL